MNSKMNIGKWIVVAFLLFAGFIATLVTICVREDIPLVTKEYYNEELKYQEQIDRNLNTELLQDKPRLSVNGNQLVLDYSDLASMKNGELKLFRPSDPRLDQYFEIHTSTSTSQNFEVVNPEKGMYRARLSWEQDGKEYYLEKIVVL
jgi:hypothetical protein